MAKNLTVGDLKDILEMVSDDLPVVIPVVDEDDSDNIISFRHVRTAGVLEDLNANESAPDIVLCINTSGEGSDIGAQITNRRSDVVCKKVLI